MSRNPNLERAARIKRLRRMGRDVVEVPGSSPTRFAPVYRGERMASLESRTAAWDRVTATARSWALARPDDTADRTAEEAS